MTVLLALALAFAQAQLDPAIQRIRAGRYAEAGPLLEAYLGEHPDSAQGYYLLGVVHFRTGKIRKASGEFRRAVELAPEDAQGWKLLGMSLSALGEFEAAESPLHRACRLAPRDPDACYYHARNCYVLSKFDESIEAFRAGLTYHPESWRLHRGLGLSLEAAGEPGPAEKHLREAVRRGRSEARADTDPRIDLGEFLFRQGRTREAAAELETALRDRPEAARARVALARCLEQKGELAEAARQLERAVAQEAENWPAHLLLGKLYFRLGRTGDGRRETRIGREGIATSGKQSYPGQ